MKSEEEEVREDPGFMETGHLGHWLKSSMFAERTSAVSYTGAHLVSFKQEGSQLGEEGKCCGQSQQGLAYGEPCGRSLFRL